MLRPVLYLKCMQMRNGGRLVRLRLKNYWFLHAYATDHWFDMVIDIDVETVIL